MRILIVDDDANIRAMIRECLDEPGNIIVEASSGEEAVAEVEAASAPFDVALLDMKMPGMGGLQALRQMKRLRPDQQVVMITAYGTVETAVEALKLGAVDYLRKPFTTKDLREIVKQVSSRPDFKDIVGQGESVSKKTERKDLISAVKSLLVYGKAEEAMALLQRMVGENPDDPEAYNLLGLLMEVKGDVLSAQRMYRAALSLNPNYEPARENLANTTEMRYRNQNTLKIR